MIRNISSKPETVKVEVELPKNVFDAAEKVCKRFDYDMRMLFTEAVRGDVQSSADGNFEDYLVKEKVPLMVDPQTHIYMTWWHSVAAARRKGLSLDDFLMDAGREYMDNLPDSKKKLTDEEKRGLDMMRVEAGIEELKEFSEEITELLGEKP